MEEVGLNIVKAKHARLIKIISACYEIMSYNVKIELFRAELSRRQIKRDIFKKIEYERFDWLW